MEDTFSSSQKYLDIMKDAEDKILEFLEEETDFEEKFIILENNLNDTKIRSDPYELLSLLHLVLKIGNNHFRTTNFFDKIERILQYFKEDIKKYYPNSELFNIFKSNKRILLFLIEQKILIFNDYIVKKITMTEKYINSSYPQYFQPEIQPFIDEDWFQKNNCKLPYKKWIKEIKRDLPENFYEKRKRGENDSTICEFIQNDLIKEFVIYINKFNISPDTFIQPSIYETNSFLIKKQIKTSDDQFFFKKDGISLIEYAAFFGSIQIFKYLRINGAKLTPSLWYFGIHGKNGEILHILEEDHIEIDDLSYKQLFYESIKCHHYEFADYFMNNFIQNKEESSEVLFNRCLKYYNFAFLKNELIGESSFCSLCKYDYCTLVDYLLKSKGIDIDKKDIFLFNC